VDGHRDEDALYVKFFGDVDRDSVSRLLDLVDERMALGTRRFVLLLSTIGGSVFHGLSAYNYLAGLPVKVETHNFGSVDSIGAVMYCAGQRRTASPHARFVLHTPFFEFDDESLGERQLAERLGKLQVDARNMAGVLAGETGRSPEEALAALRSRTVLDVPAARAWGLVHEVQRPLLPVGAEVVAVTRSAPPDAEAALVTRWLARKAREEEAELRVRAATGDREVDGAPAP
jgi:ATP-dependent Clp protease, protease subunit